MSSCFHRRYGERRLLDRTVRGGRPHLSFGLGVHRCLGEHLSRMEMRIVLEEVVSRLRDLRLVEPTDLRYSSGQSRGLQELYVTFANN